MKKNLLFLIIWFLPFLVQGQKLYPYLFKNNKWGFVDEQLNVKVKPSYDFVLPFKDGIAAVQLREGWGFINMEGKLITRIEFVDFKMWNEGLIPVQNNIGNWGFIDYTGKTKIKFIYDNADMFRFGLAPASLNNKYGFINKSGQFKIKNKYIYLSPFNKDGFTSALLSFNEGQVIDTLGNIHPHLPSYFLSIPHEGVYYKINPQNRKYGFFNLIENKAITAYEYDMAYNFNNGLAPVKKNGKWGYIDKKNNLVIDFKYDDASAFSDGLAVVKVDSKKGIINLKGEFVFHPQFDTANDFQNEVAEVEVNDLIFYIRVDGKILKE
ncbi:MAG: WG repeat-containing protein [Bacteroidota bacterium]|nr:WG repeat-containing protein [Bacteroidota bacterium]